MKLGLGFTSPAASQVCKPEMLALAPLIRKQDHRWGQCGEQILHWIYISKRFITSVLILEVRAYYPYSTVEETVSEWESFTQEYL